jgi:hypothetical protein
VESRAASVGLKVNFKAGKTEYMVFNIDGTPSLNCKGRPVVRTEDYKYLGCMCSVDKHIAARVAMAVKANTKLTSLWRSSSLHLSVKLRLFRCLVEPVLVYGLQAVGLGVAQERRLDAAFTRLLRQVHLPPTGPAPLHLTTEQIYGHVPAVTATIRRHHLALLGSIARTMAEGRARTGAYQPASLLYLWFTPRVARMPVSAPSLFNTALRYAGIDSCQLRREVRETSAADWNKFCDQRAGTRSIEHAERAEERHVVRSARKRLDQEVMAIAEARGAEETLVAEARVARTTATKLRFIARHGGDLAGSLSALASASVQVGDTQALLAENDAPWVTVHIARARASTHCSPPLVAASGPSVKGRQEWRYRKAATTADLASADLRALLDTLKAYHDCHLRIAGDKWFVDLQRLDSARLRATGEDEDNALEDAAAGTDADSALPRSCCARALADRRSRGLAILFTLDSEPPFLGGGTMVGGVKRRRTDLLVEQFESRARRSVEAEQRLFAAAAASMRAYLATMADEARRFAALLLKLAATPRGATASRPSGPPRGAAREAAAVVKEESAERVAILRTETLVFTLLRRYMSGVLELARKSKRERELLEARSRRERAMAERRSARAHQAAHKAGLRRESVKVRRYTAQQAIEALRAVVRPRTVRGRQRKAPTAGSRAVAATAPGPGVAQPQAAASSTARAPAREKTFAEMSKAEKRAMITRGFDPSRNFIQNDLGRYLEAVAAASSDEQPTAGAPVSVGGQHVVDDPQRVTPARTAASPRSREEAATATAASPSAAGPPGARAPTQGESSVALVPAPPGGALVVGSSPAPARARLDTAGLAGDERLAAEAINARGRPYDVLSLGGARLTASSTMEDIRAAYKRLALVFHSDKGRCPLRGNEAFAALTEAWHTVRDEKRPRDTAVADPAPEPSVVAPAQEPAVVGARKRRRTERLHPHDSGVGGATARPRSTSTDDDVSTVAPASMHVQGTNHDVNTVAPSTAVHVNPVAPASAHVHGDVNSVTPAVRVRGDVNAVAPSADMRGVQRARARNLGKRTREVPSGEVALLSAEEQRRVIRQMGGAGRWLEAVWRHAGSSTGAEPLSYKWLGFLTGKGGRYAQVQWLYRESQEGSADYVDDAGQRWEELVDGDGDEAVFVTSVPDVDQRIEVLVLKVHSGSPKLAPRAEDSAQATQ